MIEGRREEEEERKGRREKNTILRFDVLLGVFFINKKILKHFSQQNYFFLYEPSPPQPVWWRVPPV